jgi:hypothetical protein
MPPSTILGKEQAISMGLLLSRSIGEEKPLRKGQEESEVKFHFWFYGTLPTWQGSRTKTKEKTKKSKTTLTTNTRPTLYDAYIASGREVCEVRELVT